MKPIQERALFLARPNNDYKKFSNQVNIGNFKLEKNLRLNQEIMSMNVMDSLLYIYQDNTDYKVTFEDNKEVILTFSHTSNPNMKIICLHLLKNGKHITDLPTFCINPFDRLMDVIKSLQEAIIKNRIFEIYNHTNLMYNGILRVFQGLYSLIQNDENALRLEVVRERLVVSNDIKADGITKYPNCTTTVDISGIKIRYVYIDVPKKVYNRYVEGWHVRGHMRHYKSGKTVYIKPYYKGNNKDEKSKEYKIS